jgi:hypothetical protein
VKKHFMENRFNYFLSVIVGMIFVSPFLPPIGTKGVFPIIPFCYTVVAVFILRTLIDDAKKFTLIAVVYLLIFLTNTVFIYVESDWAPLLDAGATMAYVVVIILFVLRLFKELFRTSRVNADSIKGGICIYFLLGIVWGMVYRSVHQLIPGSFIFNVPGEPNLFYFSFVTLATLGYGDIVPATRFMQMLAILEAVTGQIFLAVYIARLLGLHMAGEMKKGS